MDVRLVDIDRDNAATLENLFELYAYDFSETEELEVGRDGRFRARALDVYFTDGRRHPLFIEVGDRLAGFALVHHFSHLTDDETRWDVGEFLVLRRYRRSGVGTRAAALVFDRFPGRWEVRERTKNVSATAFWRRAIARYTGGRYEETSWNDERWRGPVQMFDNTAR